MGVPTITQKVSHSSCLQDIESDLARGNKASTSHNTLECPSGGVASATVTQAKDLADSSTDEYMGIDRTKIVKILALCNFALPMSYFCIGFIMSFGGTPLEVRRLLRCQLRYGGRL